ncbi:hypothetical protein D5R81_09875 [Parashewanella spongiae]|uniref:Uncharacterized protein n=1 Tax=Parashewanella spongiae TaxID=342950 RepID=A0A3A6TKF0_9GAMM|nr:DsrE family protein [Parashewanella spongiae]MCL1078224.1 DsrE family protein [Parashewanella spongiae]RJY16292.1 hypothetical protein D5R81_09875 [Parashewanella spongiae]
MYASSAKLFLLFLISLYAHSAYAGSEVLSSGPVFKKFGKIAAVDTSFNIPKDMKFKVAFDMSKAAEVGEPNRNLNTLGRFINMHVASGVELENITLAMVVHGKAVADLANDDFYGKRNDGANNSNKSMVASLTKQGVKIIICGQSAAYYDLKQSDLLPNVDMALSAMTAHAILVQQGFSLNPF